MDIPRPAFRWVQSHSGDLYAWLSTYRPLREDSDLGAIVRALLDLKDERPAGAFAWMWPVVERTLEADGSARYRVVIRRCDDAHETALGCRRSGGA